MNVELWVLGAALMLLSALLTGMTRRVTLVRGILDSPNARSSHILPTPRGGGISIVLSSLAGIILLGALGYMDRRLVYALAGGGAVVALVGHLDDRGQIRIAARLVAHFSAAIWAVAWIGWPATVQLGEWTQPVGAVGAIVSVVGIVWALNLFNFMDGIDGLAASQAIFMATAGGLLSILGGLSPNIPAIGLVLASATAGFLVWNWPPARIFMGDVGSGYLGFMLAVAGLWAARERVAMSPVWLILGGVFVVDATVTLVRRLLRLERVYEPHRSHAYQWQARRWNSHLRVTVFCCLLNLLWLAPCAWLCVRFPAQSGWILAAAWIPLIALAIAGGSGRRESALGNPPKSE